MTTNYKIVRSNENGFWLSEVLDDGSFSTEEMFVPHTNKNVLPRFDQTSKAKPAWVHAKIMREAAFSLREKSMIIPASVLISFAAELYLKSLIMSNGTFSTSHKLDDLFNSLDMVDKGRIIERIRQDTTEDKFIKFITENAATFEKLRYLHDYENVPFAYDNLFWFANILHEYTEFKFLSV